MEKLICGIKFKLPKYGGKLLEEYLDKVKKYVQEKNLEQELYDDIENRIAEKLSEHKEITDMHIINLLNELGDVEEIFGQEEVEEKLQDNGKYKPFFLGLFSYLGNRLDVNPWILRIVYFLFVVGFMGALGLFGGPWLVLNILAYIAIASKYNNKVDLKGGTKGVVSSLLNAFGFFFMLIIKIIKFFFKYIFLFIFIGFSLFFGGMALVGGPLFLSNLTINNQILFANVSVFLPYGMIFAGLVLCILGAAAVFSLFKKKFLNAVSIFVLIGFGFLSIVSMFFGVYQTVSKYTTTYEKNQKVELGVLSGNIWTGESLSGDSFTGSKHISIIADIRIDDEIENVRISPFQSNISIEKSPDDKINVLVKTLINADTPENAEKVFSKINNFDISLSGNNLVIKKPKSLFNKTTVFSFLRREIVLQIPEDVSFDMKQSQLSMFYRNINFYATGYFTDCYNANISFDKVSGQFVCRNKEAEIQGCKDFFVGERAECTSYLNSYDILNCKRVLGNLALSGDIINYTERQMMDYKYCTDVLYRRQTKECNFLVGTGEMLKDMKNYNLIDYCNNLK